jgi:hypothetical protein
VAGVIVLLDVLMLATVRRILIKSGGGFWPIALLLLVPFSFLSQLGTEGALSAFLLALTMLSGYRLLLTPDRKSATLFNLVAALAVLSRLDSIFIVALLWISMTVRLWGAGKRSLQIATLPIFVVLWGAYLASNRIYFHLWQPISGMLKSQSGVAHRLGSNLPHTAVLSLTIILVSGIGLAWKRRDLFFRAIELPFAAGVVCHAFYIAFKMSSETRWSWYYTSWMLLAGVMFARFSAVLLEKRRWMAVSLGSLCTLAMVGLWFRIDYQIDYKTLAEADSALAFHRVVEEQFGIHRALAFDQPGRLAYYSNVQIIPLDGLMGDRQFQSDLVTMGIEEYVRVNRIDGLIGPGIPLSNAYHDQMCDKIYLSSVSFQCIPSVKEPGRFDISGASIYARVPAAYAGTLALADKNIIWTSRDYVSVWKLHP